MHPNAIDLTGQRFGRLVVVEEAGRDKQSKVMWQCKCDCDGTATVVSSNLKSGNTKSCGCLIEEAHTKHGMCGTPEYSSWEHMIQRCTNPSNNKYNDYGGRGITICERWKDFANFFEDMGARPADHEIDRINNDGNYEPGNCRWTTRTKQCRNMRIPRKGTSGIRGVFFDKRYKKKYRASISVKHKTICLGHFETITEAAEARRLGEIKYWGKGGKNGNK